MIESVVQILLAVPAVQAVVGNRIALQQLRQGSEYPALVHQVVSSTPWQRLCSPSTAHISRVQINPIAPTMVQVNDLHDLVRTALQSDAERVERTRLVLQWSEYYGLPFERVVSCRLQVFGPATRDEFTGMWTKPADYLIHHERLSA
jgi:hypothetical protein